MEEKRLHLKLHFTKFVDKIFDKWHMLIEIQAYLVFLVIMHVYRLFFFLGYCARFSEVNKRIINDPGLDCTKFDPPCPARFPSNESYKCKWWKIRHNITYYFCFKNTYIIIFFLPFWDRTTLTCTSIWKALLLIRYFIS